MSLIGAVKWVASVTNPDGSAAPDVTADSHAGLIKRMWRKWPIGTRVTFRGITREYVGCPAQGGCACEGYCFVVVPAPIG